MNDLVVKTLGYGFLLLFVGMIIIYACTIFIPKFTYIFYIFAIAVAIWLFIAGIILIIYDSITGAMNMYAIAKYAFMFIIAGGALSAFGYFLYYMTTQVNYTPQVVNLIILIFFLFAIITILVATLPRGIISYTAFINQSGVSRMILTVMATAIVFMFLPHSFTTSHKYATALLLMAIFIMMMWAASAPASLAYLASYKMSAVISFVAVLAIIWYNNPADVFNSTFITNNAIFLVVIAAYLLVLAIIYMGDYSGIMDSDMFRALNMGAGIVVSGIFIIWLAYLILQLYNKPSVGTTIFILIAAIFVIYSLFATFARFITIYDGNQARVNAFSGFINNTVMYLPCLADNAYGAAVGRIANMVGSKTVAAASSIPDNIRNTPAQMWSLLVIAISLAIAFYYIPEIQNKLYAGNMHQLLVEPIAMNGATTVANYSQLTDTADSNDPHYNYRYGISLWYYLDAYGANMNEAYNKYTPIFNYGNKPIIEYNGLTNSLRIRIGTAKGEPITVFEQRGAVQLQKWTNIVVNFMGGTVDVFVDGRLLKSTGGVIPYMNQDSIIVGTQYGIYGKCCNILYSSSPFSSYDIYYLRYLVKDNNPPIYKSKLG